MHELPTTFIGLISVVVIGIGGAIAAVATWLRPRLDAILTSIPQMVENEVKNKEILSQLAVSFAILSRIMTAQHAEMNRARRQIVIVEDNPIESQVVATVCTTLARKYKLSLKDVTTLSEAFGLLANAVVVVLDARLPDSTVTALNAMIDVSPGPVIIYSSEDVSKEQFPRAFRVIRHSGQDELQSALKEAVEAAIVQSTMVG